MLYAWLANGVLLLHLGFILFVLFGGLALALNLAIYARLLRRRKARKTP